MRSILSWFKKKKVDTGIRFVALDETDSTNRYCLHSLDESALPAPEAVRMVVVTTEYQSAGRGQGTNTWESERGQNLLFSVVCHPVWVPVRMQFVLSECMAMAIHDALAALTEGITVKWPNDIYWHDRKICGILIENRLAAGCIRDCVLGVGLNVNQRMFRSDAPNPVSLVQILGRETDRQTLLADIVQRFDDYLALSRKAVYGSIAGAYMASLYRSRGFHSYRDCEGDFEAAIVEVEDDGHLILRDREGFVRSYAFKEVEFRKDQGALARSDWSD